MISTARHWVMRAIPFELLPIAVILAGIVIPFACRTQGNNQPPQTAATAASGWDGGLPPPPPSSRKGIVVPSDMGMGAGPAGATTNSGVNNAPANPIQAPGPSP